MAGLPKPVGLPKLVEEARYLRDYMIHEGGEDSALGLTNALWPFERDSDMPGEEAAQKLYAAFQRAHREARETVDHYTLGEVLKGRSPHIRPTPIMGSMSLALLGVVLVALAFHFSYWANRTNYVLAEAQRWETFDHFSEVMKLVELENFFEQAVRDDVGPDLEPQLLYLEGLATLRAHYSIEASLPQRMRHQQISLDPFGGFADRIKRRYCPRLSGEGTWHKILDCPPDPLGALNSVQKLDSAPARSASEAQAFVQTPPERRFQTALKAVSALRDETMETAGRSKGMSSDYAQSLQSMRTNSSELASKLDIVHRWLLPIIYGAMGSVVYCIWRILNSSHAALGFYYTVLRTAFAGLAALTLSMLLVPSDTLTLGVEASRPLIYLTSFIFGYSIEAFVSTLNNLNRAMVSSLSPKERPGATG